MIVLIGRIELSYQLLLYFIITKERQTPIECQLLQSIL